jgi:hypothetical protein
MREGVGFSFDDRETRIMGDAVAMALHVVGPPRDEGEDLRATSILKRNIASTILDVAAHGVMDSGIMAQAAIDRVLSASRFPIWRSPQAFSASRSTSLNCAKIAAS